MTVKYSKILRLNSIGFSQRNIALSVPCSRNTVAKTLERAKDLGISWPLPDGMTDAHLGKLLFNQEELTAKVTRRMPDYEYIRKELLKNGVNKKLLWTEYLEECKQSGDQPLMYSQFCYYIQKDEEKRLFHGGVYEMFESYSTNAIPTLQDKSPRGDAARAWQHGLRVPITRWACPAAVSAAAFQG